MAHRRAQIWLAAALFMSTAVAQTVTPQNLTIDNMQLEQYDRISLSVSEGQSMVTVSAVSPDTMRAGADIPPTGLSGPVIFANASNQLSIVANDVAIISCDPSAYAGNIGALDVFATAEQANASTILWYSIEADWCNLSDYTGSYSWIYSMKSLEDTQKMLGILDSKDGELNKEQYYMQLKPVSDSESANGTTGNGSTSSGANSQNQSPNPLGPSPSTAVAMIILYSITGIITALFLVIIITGAVRAHRHPERYGPRNLVGRARQSRAKGLARAMLETIPIVKFGEREEPKQTDVELANASTNDNPEVLPESEGSNRGPETLASGAADPKARDLPPPTDEGRPSIAEGGIAAATATRSDDRAAEPDSDNQGCSICTEDFEIGQDQRVLPCNHRFHPACIDPWLLDVSGTCPLCRIDLRPQTSRSSEPELDADGNPIHREGESSTGDLPPPLGPEGQDSRRTSVRRSLMFGLMSIGRPDRMNREERVLALRQYRSQQAAEMARSRREREAAAGASTDSPAEVPEDDSRLRTRLRNTFRVRTRRTGQDDAPAPDASASAVPEAADEAADARRQGTFDGPAGR